jgi:hypothetical protein
VYLAGAFDTVVGVEEAEDPWGLKNSLHYRKCVRDSHMTLRQLSQNVIAFAATKPELKDTWVVRALLLYLQTLCGHHAAFDNQFKANNGMDDLDLSQTTKKLPPTGASHQ